ncbi:MAG: CRISPR-associated protein Csx11 [Thaumarchaeota archaeon]|nr:MAG: CRISPR-associated protein Csx11 [Nitrososphaerota archaeon]
MIPLIEIKEKAVAEGVPETTVMKDYALSWMLKALNDVSEAFALKGGTGIRKAYVEGYRFSVDLDFTLTERVDVREVLLDAVRLARRESGIEFGEDLGLRSVRTGYEARVMFRLYYRFPMRIKIDVTTPENEAIVLPLERRKLIHPYSDECDALLLVYSLREIFAEKVRSLFERTRPRDLYDVWYLSGMVELEEAVPVIKRKFEHRGLELRIERFLERREVFRAAWAPSLENQLRELPGFDRVFAEVERTLRTISKFVKKT